MKSLFIIANKNLTRNIFLNLNSSDKNLITTQPDFLKCFLDKINNDVRIRMT